MSRARELLRSIKNLSVLRELAKTNGGLDSVGDLVDNFIDSEAMVVCLQRFKALPGGKEMVEQRYPPFQPDIPVLEKLPEGTLGRAYACMIRRLNYDADFFRPRDTSSEALWLTQRIASTHDLHHVIGGFNTETAGESGVLSITATQIGFPAYVLLNTLAGFRAFRFQPNEFEKISRAIAVGSRIGLEATPLVLQRWEEGWDKPLDQWRQELGVKPAAGEAFGAEY
ncbi:Coenzyme Q (ubiquinone) biosynthesis protein Coq4 [Synechococcus sp. MIT S9509]|uniref:Coq4 family protein n=1 Tax=unclassified Synechococcus TaxID=2626047 RepID=UPI0007BB852A|nr:MULTISPECIES: Coq4 family protein [unclassified Synechococcus]KZR85137.1 Coenzyme Q (ubiquinone) biosynthesis protein Coq4 [Synechococcus sp. MIT S9504]KZR91330.1 Coenzyme Q (ubiquinone) biosynthesis protein Coq4 [Synechococcus sp. MIT S9509]